MAAPDMTVAPAAARLAFVAVALAACAGVDGAPSPAGDRDRAIAALTRDAGAAVAVELHAGGALRVLAMTPGFPVPGRGGDPAAVALDFVAAYRDAFQLGDAEARELAVTRVDRDAAGDLRHVTLQRRVAGVPVFQGAITVHLDAGNGVLRVLGDEFYRAAPPSNRAVIEPAAAAIAAGRAHGLALAPALAASDGPRTAFEAAGTLDPIRVEPWIVELASGDARTAYQVLLSWPDASRQQYRLLLIDAQSGDVLGDFDLVDAFTGRVFSAAAQPTAGLTTDTRTLVGFDGDPDASPDGWIGAARTTVGNNAVACTDRNGNNSCTGETPPVADANDRFDFPFDPLQNAQGFAAAAVTSAFFLVNDWHDRTYRLGFTETAGNFQTVNFGRGGMQNDAVNVDAQDSSTINNANFATPPDGARPRMQMSLFTLSGGATEDGDFDPSVVFHEHTHGLSNRLVGGGSAACLSGLQSNGMGEGWSDFVAASFLGNPVIGAYVTGNPTIGIRKYSMASSPLGYADVASGKLVNAHDVGELWAATLWDLRGQLGAAVIEQLVVSGMKLTPCSPTMLHGRDAILAADANLDAAAHRCALWQAFAARGMGSAASSPSHNSSAQIVTSSAVPLDCVPGTTVTRDFASADVDVAIPDDSPLGVAAAIEVPAGLDVQRVTVDVAIAHPFRGDLVVRVIAPSGQAATLFSRTGGGADDVTLTGQDISASFMVGSAASGIWRLFVQDLAPGDAGAIRAFTLHLTSTL
jgi:hypothetical protein